MAGSLFRLSVISNNGSRTCGEGEGTSLHFVTSALMGKRGLGTVSTVRRAVFCLYLFI